MRKPILSLVLGTLLVPALAGAQATVDLRVNLPVVLPQLVVVSPGVQVVPDVDDEVFFVERHYWVRRGGAWYRSPSHRGGWVLVPARAVPAHLVKIPPGHYRKWKGERRHDDHDRGHDRDYDRHERHGKGKHKGKHD